MTKIDRRRNYFLCIDTETVPVDKDFDGVSPYNMWVYDVGFAVIDKHGNVYETFSFVNADKFFLWADTGTVNCRLRQITSIRLIICFFIFLLHMCIFLIFYNKLHRLSRKEIHIRHHKTL